MSDKKETVQLRDMSDPKTSAEFNSQESDAVVETSLETAVEASTGQPEAKKERNNVHVVFNETVWNVKRPGGEILFESATKQDAVDHATSLAKELKAELIIHGKNGKIQNRNSYGNDPKGRG